MSAWETIDPSARPVALVTGAARGIGAATVERLTSEGWSVLATDVCADDPRLDYPLATMDDLAMVAASNEHCMTRLADVCSVDDLCEAVDEAVENFGRLDAVIAVAGVLAGGATSWETSEGAWDAQMEVNLGGVWNLARAAVPTLLRFNTFDAPAGHTSFIAVSSAAGVHGLPMLGAYSASKHAVIGLVTAMAAELGPHGVTANVICPGSTRTAILDESVRIYDLDGAERFSRHHLLRRLLEPSEIAATISHLCGPDGRGITGAVIPVDAGMGAS